MAWNYHVYSSNSLEYDTPTQGVNQPIDCPSSPVYLDIYRSANHDCLSRIGEGEKGYHLIRDPRDVIISNYWSWKVSHKNNSDNILRNRAILNELDVKQGILYLIQQRLVPYLQQIEDWPLDYSPLLLPLRYENLNADLKSSLYQILEFLGLEARHSILDDMATKFTFEAMAKRKPGEEDVSAHRRKGIAGDWKNYFDADISAAFKETYGDIVERLGYEESGEW